MSPNRWELLIEYTGLQKGAASHVGTLILPLDWRSPWRVPEYFYYAYRMASCYYYPSLLPWVSLRLTIISRRGMAGRVPILIQRGWERNDMSKYKMDDGNGEQAFDSVQELCGALRYVLRRNVDPAIVIPVNDSHATREVLSVFASSGRNVEISTDSSSEAIKHLFKCIGKEIAKVDGQLALAGALDKFLDGKSIILTHKDMVDGHIGIAGSSLIIDNLPDWMPDLTIGFGFPFFTIARIAVKLAKAGYDAYTTRPIVIKLSCEAEDTQLVFAPVPA